MVNNHVPVDPILGGALIVTKSTPMLNVSVGDLVPYTITVTNTLDALLTNVDVRDLLPPGFAYRGGSASANGVVTEPQRAGRQLTWVDQSFASHERRTYKLVLVVGAGVGEGEYVNQAFALNNLVGATISNVATAAVRVVPDPVFDCPDLIGKVFDDRNANGYQDDGEPGIANVRLAALNGVLVTTDAEGRYHVALPRHPQRLSRVELRDETRRARAALGLSRDDGEPARRPPHPRQARQAELRRDDPSRLARRAHGCRVRGRFDEARAAVARAPERDLPVR